MVHWKQSGEESTPLATRNLSIKISNDMRVKARFAVQAKLCWNFLSIYYMLCIVYITEPRKIQYLVSKIILLYAAND